MLNTYQKQWEFLKNKFEAGQLGHAYLLSGRGQTEKEFFAKEFVKLINCLYSNFNDRANLGIKEIPCGECQNCKMIGREGFPDLMIIRSINSESSIKNEKDMMSIETEQIRDTQNFLSYKSYYGGFSARGGSAFGGKAVIIDNAERMTPEAQNCFLKSLEEPKGKTIIFLLAAKTDLLLPTIVSRCQEIKFFQVGKYDLSKEEQEILKDLLNVAGSDLAIKFQYTKNINLEEGNFDKILEILQRYFRDLLLLKMGVISKISVAVPTLHYNTASKVKEIIKLIENLSHQSRITNINNRLALEIVLLEL